MTEQAMREAAISYGWQGSCGFEMGWQAALQWAAKQEPLGEPFQSILNVNRWELYESEDLPPQASNADLQAEMAEQCRIIGMGAERELSLLAEVERLRRALDVVVARTKFVHPGEATWRLCVISNIANAALAKGE